MASRLALLLLFLAACARTTLQASVVDEHGGTDEFAEMDFWDGLAEADLVSNHDALHALLLYYGDAGASSDFPSRLAAARERGWVDPERPLPENETARVGWIARAVCLEAGIEGGLTMRVFGPSERYSLRELNYLGWLPNMSRHQAVSGPQLIALLSRAEDYVAGSPKVPREDL